MANSRLSVMTFVLLFHSFFIVHSKDYVRSRRATTMENVDAIYNRFTRTSKGKANYYGEYPGDGLCSLDPPPPLADQPGWVKIAVGKDDFQGSLGCGMCVEIRGTGIPLAPNLNGGTPGVVRGMVYDLCGSCQQGDIDLYVPGKSSPADITMRAIDCPFLKGSVGFIQFRFTQSNEYYFKVQARNARIPVAGMEVFNTVTSDWYCLKKTSDNYFTSEGLGKVTFPIKVRVTSITNEKLETTITTLKNDESFPSDIQFSGFKETGGSPADIECYGQGHKSTKDVGPEVDERFCAGKEDGIYADPNDCSAFYECANGKSYKQYCANGLKFNALTGKCDDPEKVNCQDVGANEMFSEDMETQSLLQEDISTKSINEHERQGVRKKRHVYEVKTPRTKRHHHHHHLHKRSKFHGRHKRHRFHIKPLHLEATKAKVHQAAKRTAGKGVNLKVKVQFKGPNLSGTLVSNDPMNSNEGDITLSAVHNAEEGDPSYTRPAYGQENEDHTTTTNFGQDSKHSNSPFNFEDTTSQFQEQSRDEEGHPMRGDLIVQATQMQDGTLQTSTSVRPKEMTESTEHSVSESSKMEQSGHPTKIKSLTRNSFQTKPRVVSQKEGDDDKNSALPIIKVVQNNPPENFTKNEKEHRNRTETKAMQGIMETIKLLKQITKGNTTKNDKNSNSENIKMETASFGHPDKSKETTSDKQVTKPDGKVLSSPKLNNTNNDDKIPPQSKEKASEGILFVISRARNSSKQDTEGTSGHKVIIMPNIGTKVHSDGNTTVPKHDAAMKENEQNLSITVTPQLSLSIKQASKPDSPGETQRNSTADLSKSSPNLNSTKDTNNGTSSPEPTSLSGLIGMIGSLVKSKLQNRFNQTKQVPKESAKNGTAALEDVNKNITIGKINISLQSMEQHNPQQSKDGGQGTIPRYHPTVSMKPLTAAIHVNKPFQVVGVPVRTDPGALDQIIANASVNGKLLSTKENPSNISGNDNIYKQQGQEKTDTSAMSTRNGSQGAKGTETPAPIPIMRIRLKGPSNKVRVVSISQNHHDSIFSTTEKQKSIDPLRNDDKSEAVPKAKPLHTTTVIIRQYNKDPKPVNYGTEDILDTLPMKGSEDFDANGNMKMEAPVISMNDAQGLLEGDKALIDNTAMQNALYNPDANAFSDHKEDSLKSSQQNTITENEVGQGGADDFAQALQRQDDQPKHQQKMASKENEHPSQAVTIFPNERPQAHHTQRFKEIEEAHNSKLHPPVMSRYMNNGAHPMGMQNGNYGNYMNMNDPSMGINIGNGIQMSGGMNGMASNRQGAGMSPVEMQPITGSEEDVNKGMKQMLTNMQDMAMKQIQSKYPGMPITMKPEDSEESEEEQQQTESGGGQEEAGSTPSTQHEVYGKHKEDKVNKEKGEDSSQGNGVRAEEGSGSELTPKLAQPSASDSTPKQDDKKEDNNESHKQDHENVPVKEKAPVREQDHTAVTVKKIDPKELCRTRTSGVYANEQDPSKFIICYNGVTEERECSNGMVFNPREKVCEPSDSYLASKMKDEAKSKDKSKNTKGKAKDSAKGRKSSKNKN